MKKRICIAMPESIIAAVDNIAAAGGQSRSSTVIEALRYYTDRDFLAAQQLQLQQQIVSMLDKRIQQVESNITAKQCNLLSAANENLYVMQRLIADNLQITEQDVNRYQGEAAQFIKSNNRIFRMTEALRGGDK